MFNFFKKTLPDESIYRDPQIWLTTDTVYVEKRCGSWGVFLKNEYGVSFAVAIVHNEVKDAEKVARDFAKKVEKLLK